LKQINTGALTIDNENNIIEDASKMAEWKVQEETRVAADLVRQQEEAKWRKEHEEHLEKLRQEDMEDIDEIKDQHTEHKDLFKDVDEDLTEE